MNVMLDLETMGTKPGSVILSIGAAVFDKRGVLDTFYRVINPYSSTGKAEVGTAIWWTKQSEQARAILTDHEKWVTQPQAFTDFETWWMMVGGEFLWAHGATFDPVLYEALRGRTPWKFNNVSDTRTVYRLAGVDVAGFRAEGTHHNALDDAKAQAEAIIYAYQKLGVEL
jgi:hypothetical protein